MEYLAVVGISFFLIIPMIIIFFDQSNALKDDITAIQIEKIGLEIMDAAEEVYYLGPPSTKYLTVYLPAGVEAITISSQEITFSYQLGSALLDYPLGTGLPLNLSGTMSVHPGQHHVTVQAQDDGVAISDSS